MKIFDITFTSAWDAAGIAAKAMAENKDAIVKIQHRLLPNSERECWIIWVSKGPLNVRKEETKKES